MLDPGVGLDQNLTRLKGYRFQMGLEAREVVR